ncbi:MAG TPA: aspartate kinase [Planctomycetota bacterium]|nr:aspartate kinase [Planctomycetota bacterium]
MKVMKFGGTSMGSPESITGCAELVEREIKLSGKKPLVIVSAHSGKGGSMKVTDRLLEAARKSVKGDVDGPFKIVADRHHEILDGLKLPRSTADKLLGELHDLLKGIHMVKEVTPRLFDFVASFGERLSARCFAALLQARGHREAEAFDAYDLGLVTDSRFMNARPLPETYEKISEAFKPHANKLAVVTGFIAKDKGGDITTIGRSGSDFSAAIFGAALNAEEIQVWKDVPGVMSCDPTLIKNVRPLPKLSFEEASELAYYGAEVLHPATMIPAMKRDIPVRVLHTFDPEAPGTLITNKAELDPKFPVKCIVYKEDQVLINVRSERMLGMEGFMARLFAIFERHHIVIDMISTSEVSVSLTTNTTDPAKLDAVRKDLGELASKVEILPEKCIVAVVGEGMKHAVGLAARTFRAVAASGVSLQMISQGASEINITFLVDNSEIPKVCESLHKEYFG